MNKKELDQHLPLHARVSEVPIRTPVDVRLGVALVPARYVLRWLAEAVTSTNTFFKQHTLDPIIKRITPSYYGAINTRLAALSHGELKEMLGTALDASTSFDMEAQKDILMGQITRSPAGQRLIRDIARIQRVWGAGGEAENTVEYALRDYVTKARDASTLDGLVPTMTLKSMEKILPGKMPESIFKLIYDNMLGVASFGMTYAVRQRVLNDMTSLFSETVAYELDKSVDQVTKADIFASKNNIIESTVENYRAKLGQRLAISMVPFLKNLKSVRALGFSDLAVGLWGGFWAYDVWGREPTMLELFSDFANDKLNPKFGIGDKFRSGEIINLYQQYAIKFHPDWAYNGVLTSDPAEHRIWAQSEKIFERVADLMNHTYNYKHPAHIDPETGFPTSTAKFPLPKLIYLLGHDLINVHRPEWSLAYVEIANEHGMKAVKDVQKLEAEGVPLPEVLTRYPLSSALMATSHVPPAIQQEHASTKAHENITLVAETRTPDHHVSSHLAEASRLAPHSAQQLAQS